jgi:diguanylate cyclase (GGDEF)-like protein
MKTHGKSRIGQRIGALVLLSVMLSISAMTAAVLGLQLRDSVKDRRAAIEATGYVLAASIADHVAEADNREVTAALRAIRRLPDLHLVVVTDRNGQQLATLGSASMLDSDIAWRDTGYFALLNRGWLPVMTQIIKGNELVGQVIIVADISDLRNHALRTLLATLLVAALAAAIGIIAAVRLQHRITRPILSLIQAMAHVRQARDYSTKVTHDADDETGMLVDSFNDMMAEVNYRDESLRKLAYFDPLTGVANRQEFQRCFTAALEVALSNGPSCALFLIDIDEFKSVNDSFGHSAGDSLLMEVAARFNEECGAGQKLARLGGDEFGIIMEGVASRSSAEAAIAPFLAALLRPLELAGRQIAIGASVGVAFAPMDGISTVDLLRRADLALYAAKRDGKGRVKFFDSSMDEDMQSMMSIAQDLRRALAEGQFEAHYQAQFALRDCRIEGFEALIRWKHPERGYIPPAKFIPIAESNGLICDIGHWMLETACVQAKAWLDAGLDCGLISVNVSVPQLRQSAFVQEVAQILSETGLPPERLCLELTESLFAGQSAERVKTILLALKGLGIQLALDDFGTGYSSLAYLLDLPFDKLKIDRAFVLGVAESESRGKLLRGVVELAHALGLRTVAEGAETLVDVSILREIRVDHVQGYALSRPAPADDAMAVALSASRGMFNYTAA